MPEVESEVISAEILPKLPDLQVETPQKHPKPVVEASSGVRGDRKDKRRRDPLPLKIEIDILPGDDQGLTQGQLCERAGLNAANLARDVRDDYQTDSKSYLESATGWQKAKGQQGKWFPPSP